MSGVRDATQFNSVDHGGDARYFIEFLDARKTIEGESEVKASIIEMLSPTPGARVLDVGCGDDARAIAALVGPSGKLVGIDVSGAMIAESRRRSEGSELPVEFDLGDVRKIGFPEESFDRVRTDRVLTFVTEVDTAIGEILRVLRPGGRVVASEIDHELHFCDSRFA